MLDKTKHRAKRAAADVIIGRLLKNADKNREKTFAEIVDISKKYYKDAYTEEQYAKMKEAVTDPENRWNRYINALLDETNPQYARTMLLNLGFEAFLNGTKTIREMRKIHHCNIPWLILFDPTSACNMHCEGCWSGTYGRKYNMSFEDMDKIVTQGKEIGVYLYMMTGGEPMVRFRDVEALAKKHNDCTFALYTNSTLISEEVCRRVVELGNITFFISIEGSEETNDKRRGEGHYQAVMKAMSLLKEYGIAFGTSVCYTSANIEAVTSDEFIKMLADNGARYGFYFHYMPVGNNAVPDLLPTVEQRKYMIERIREIRNESDFLFYPMDFQNDGEYAGGCIAGGRNYFHINSNGDAEPCVFIHYSDSNIKDKTILEILKSPLFMAYHEGQPFNKNHLRPCPMLENPELLGEMVKKSGAHSTDLESPETTEHLYGKCKPYAQAWADEADRIWDSQVHKQAGYENYKGWEKK